MNYLAGIRNASPLIHCLTNTVTVNDCANALLAVGARPVMAEHPAEAAQITSNADALLINMGTITDAKIAAMKISAKAAGDKPFVIDCVGVSSSDLRLGTVTELLHINTPRIIKGNASEIAALCTGKITGGGVDALQKCNIDTDFLKRLASDTGAVIAVTGAEDIITDGSKITRVKNGSPLLKRVTGTGCMLGCIMAALLTVAASPADAAAYAAAVMGICAEKAERDFIGTGTFRVRLMDALSVLTDTDICANINIY